MKNNCSYDQLIQRCLDQDRLAQKEIYQALFGKMRGVCRRYISNPKEVSEVLNTSFLTVFQKLHEYKSIDNFDAWVRRIVINKSIDHLRYHKHFKEVTLPELPQNVTVSYNDGDSAMRMQELYDLIDQLPPMAKAVFNLYAIDGFSHKEIGEKLEINASTSRWHLSSARLQLQEKLNKNDSLHVGVV